MTFKYLTLFLLAILTVTPALAGDLVANGEINLGYRFGDYDSGSSAKFEEYGDWDEELVGSFSLFTAKDSLYFRATADTGGLKGTAGAFNEARLSLFYDEFDHNYSFNNITPHIGQGSDTLTIIPGYNGTSTANWIPIDYSVERKHYGAGLDLTATAPFYFSLEAERIEKDGTIPWGANSRIELPMPVDHDTTTARAQGSYRNENLLVQIDGSISKFENNYDVLNYQNASGSDQRPIVLAPDNDFWQIGGQIVLRDLPMASTLALRGSYSSIESDTSLLNLATNQPDVPWDGEIDYTSASMILRSKPLGKLDTEISYRYLDKSNDSDIAVDGDGKDAGVLEYTKHHAAIEAAYRLNPANRLAAGFDFLSVDRDEEVRPDAEKNTDQTIFVEWKNSSFDFLTSKVRYEYLTRDTDIDSSATLIVSSPYDAAEKDQDKLILAFNVMPKEGLDIGLEYNYRTADYDDSDFGRTEDLGHELIVDASVSLPAKANLYAYAAYEKVQNEYTADPDPADTYDVELTDKNWSYGVKLTVPLLEDRLKLTASWDYQENDGEADFSSSTTALVDIDDYDDYTLQTFELKADYAIRKNLSLILGYMYEKYDYDDLRMEDYLYQLTTSYILTGAYSDPEYDVNLGYFGLRYIF